MKKVVTGLGIAAVLLAGKLIWSVVHVEKHIDVTAEELAEQSDEWLEDEMDLASADEVRAWLETPGTQLYEVARDEAEAVVDRLYEAGAEGIWIVGAELLDGVVVADEIAIRMPSEPAARRRLLDAYDALWDDVPTPDNGQAYLTFVFH